MAEVRRDAPFLSLLYATGLRPAEAVALELADLDLVNAQLRVRSGKGRKPQPVSLPASALPALHDWLQARGPEPGSLFCSVLKKRPPGPRSARAAAGSERVRRLAIFKERWRKAGISPPAPHDLRRT